MTNFPPEEEALAATLLEAFVYFSHELVDRLFIGAFDALAEEVTAAQTSYLDKKLVWKNFAGDVLITHPTGEMPNVTDSGYAFDRRARQLVRIPQEHILEPESVIETIVRSGPRPVLLVDDFVGSGDQFRKTWHRSYQIGSTNTSLADLAARADAEAFFYCPLICTELGKLVIDQSCSGARLRPTHLLPTAYSANDASSLVWPESMRTDGQEFVRRASARAGIPPAQQWGYSDLALALAFEHGVPDATLPLLWWEENDWIPLVRRT